MNPNDITYKKATEELEAILRAIENDTLDVDELTQKVQRSSELIKICKQKLRSAESAINEVFQDIDCETPAAPAAAEATAGPGNGMRVEKEEDDGELPF
jgi:exodeoxyribonuclease VII small subunit